jgi:hypothetical protein
MTIEKEDRASSVDMTTAAATSAPHKILALNGPIGIDMGIDTNALNATKVGQGADSLITTEKITSYSRINYIMNSQRLQDRFKNGFTGLIIIS